jgi:hypothetical protein
MKKTLAKNIFKEICNNCMIMFCLVLSFCSIKDNQNPIDTIGFRFVDREVYFRDNDFEFTIELSSSANKNLIFYAFKRVHEALSSDSLFYSEFPSGWSAGNAIFIEDVNGLLKDLTIKVPLNEDSMAYKPFPNDFLEQLNSNTAKKYTQATEILYSKSKKKITLSGKLELFPLPKGEYRMYLIYYCGDDLRDFIKSEVIKADEKKYNATKLSGWIKSNSVKLIVE